MNAANSNDAVPAESAAATLPLPIDLLPHRPPFLLVDELVELEPLVSAVGRWHLTGDEYFFAGHFPGQPTLPGVLMVEALAQVGACAALVSPKYAGKIPFFGAADKLKFRRQVVPGETLELEVAFTRMSGRGGKATGIARVGDEVACTAELLVVMANPA